jgi:hypothetical protein
MSNARDLLTLSDSRNKKAARCMQLDARTSTSISREAKPTMGFLCNSPLRRGSIDENSPCPLQLFKEEVTISYANIGRNNIRPLPPHTPAGRGGHGRSVSGL